MVPEGTSDETLISVATQFQYNRFPVVTWKQLNRQAVLLRSGCFIPSTASQKIGPLENLQNVVLHGKGKFIGVGGKFGGHHGASKDKGVPQGNLSGTGVFNMDVESYIRDIMHLSQSHRRKRQKSNLVQEISGPPEMMHFVHDHTRGRPNSRTGTRAQSWDSDDVDFSPQRRRLAMEGERSLTPEPQVDRLYASPEPVKKEKRRFTVSNIFQKASPHFTRKKRYKVASAITLRSSPDRDGSPTHPVKASPENARRLQKMRLPLKEADEPEEKDELVSRGNLVDGRDSGEGAEGRGGEGEKGRRREGEQRGSEDRDRASSERDSVDRLSIVQKLGLEKLTAQSPTRGIPKTYSLKRSASLSEVSDLEAGHDEVDIDDINMVEKRESSISPEPVESRKSTIDWEAVGGNRTPDELLPPEDLRPSTSTPEVPHSPSSRLGRMESYDTSCSSVLWASPQKQGAGHVRNSFHLSILLSKYMYVLLIVTRIHA